MILSSSIREAIETGLTVHFCTPVRIAEAQNIPLSWVFRCALQVRNDAVPESIMVRLPREGMTRGGTEGLRRERVALEYLASLGCTIAPQRYAGGEEEGYVASEDLGRAPSVLDLMLGEDAEAATAGALGFARCLGKLHAATIAGAGSHHTAELPHERALVEESWEKVRKAADVLGLPQPQGVEDDIVSIARTLHSNTPWLALSSGDPSVVNCKVLPAGVRFFDFEAACFRHALIDAAVLRFFYPTGGPSWQIPKKLIHRMEETYRTELSCACPMASDDSHYETALNAACAAWMLLRLERLERVDAGPDKDSWMLLPGGWSRPIPSRSRRRQLVSIAETWSDMAKRADAFPSLAAWADETVIQLRDRWPEAHEGLPIYPVFAINEN